MAVLTGSGHEKKAYELAGDRPFTMAELAAEVSRQIGRTIVYTDLPPEQFRPAELKAYLKRQAPTAAKKCSASEATSVRRISRLVR